MDACDRRATVCEKGVRPFVRWPVFRSKDGIVEEDRCKQL